MSEERSEGPIRTIQGGPLDGTPTVVRGTMIAPAIGFVVPGGTRHVWFYVPAEFAIELDGIRYQYRVEFERAELVIRWTGESRTVCG